MKYLKNYIINYIDSTYNLIFNLKKQNKTLEEKVFKTALHQFIKSLKTYQDFRNHLIYLNKGFKYRNISRYQYITIKHYLETNYIF